MTLDSDDSVSLAVSGSDQLGEGPHWLADTQTLYWVDIVDPALQSCTLNESGELDASTLNRRPLPRMTGVVVPCHGGGFIAAGESGIHRLDESLAETLIADPESQLPENRFNDGKCDSRGRLWAGSLSMAGTAEQASLWRIDPDHRVTHMVGQVGVSNGLGWNADETLFYYTDSVKRTIYVYDFDADTGTLSNRRVFVGPDSSSAGAPDGLAVDEEDCIWSAQWDGACVIRYRPDGSVDRVVKVPVHRPTSCAFGGRDGRTLFVTSARVGLTEKQLAAAPLAGSVFAIDAGVGGQPGQLFGHR